LGAVWKLQHQPPRPATPLDIIERNGKVRLFETLLNEMDELNREMLVMVDLDELTVPEASDILQIPLDTAYSRLRAARRTLEEALVRRVGPFERRVGARSPRLEVEALVRAARTELRPSAADRFRVRATLLGRIEREGKDRASKDGPTSRASVWTRAMRTTLLSVLAVVIGMGICLGGLLIARSPVGCQARPPEPLRPPPAVSEPPREEPVGMAIAPPAEVSPQAADQPQPRVEASGKARAVFAAP
jgi:hypothetical protein